MIRIYEQHGGYLIAIFVHLLILTIMMMMERSEARMNTPAAMEVSVQLQPAPAAAEDSEAEVAPPPPDVVAATGDNVDVNQSPLDEFNMEEQEQPEEVEAVADALDLVPEPTPQPTPEQTPEPESEPVEEEQPEQEMDPEALAEQIAREQRERKERMKQAYLNRLKAQSDDSSSRLKALRGAIESDVAKHRGMDLLEEWTPGADSGAVRDFDLTGPTQIVEEIMRRYEMRYVRDYYDEEEINSGYINRTRTERGTYTPSSEPGFYEALEIGKRGIEKLRALEAEALRAYGYRPGRDRVLLIRFGIVRTERGWDLGVIDFKGQRVE